MSILKAFINVSGNEGVGRNLQKGLKMQACGAAFCALDLVDAFAVHQAMRNVDFVVHAAALAAPWGRRKDFWAANVVATRHVIQGCISNSVRRLIYISTPSIISRLEDQFDLNETAPTPAKFVSEYARSKSIAEGLIRGIDSNILETVILRPKAIYGPGDNNLFPRVLDAALKGRLPIIGDGSARTNLTHIDDAVQSVRLALDEPEAVGKTYFITSGEDIRIWDACADILRALDIPLPTRTLSLSKALMMGRAMEMLWGLLRLPGEPPLTRYAVAALGYSQTLDISAARCELNFAPQVSASAGIDAFVRWRRSASKTKTAEP